MFDICGCSDVSDEESMVLVYVRLSHQRKPAGARAENEVKSQKEKRWVKAATTRWRVDKGPRIMKSPPRTRRFFPTANTTEQPSNTGNSTAATSII